MDKITGLNTTTLDGIQTNLRRLREAAQQIGAQREIEASAAVLRRANDALDTVLKALR